MITVLKFYRAVTEKRAKSDLSYVVPQGRNYKELSRKSRGLQGSKLPIPR